MKKTQLALKQATSFILWASVTCMKEEHLGGRNYLRGVR